MILVGLGWVGLQSVTLHTNVGEIKCEIFCDEVPKTAEVQTRASLGNFVSVVYAPTRWFCDTSMNLFLRVDLLNQDGIAGLITRAVFL